jgi:hypothetical protein
MIVSFSRRKKQAENRHASMNGAFGSSEIAIQKADTCSISWEEGKKVANEAARTNPASEVLPKIRTTH